MECSNAQVLAWINLDDIVLNELGDLMTMIQDQELRQTFNNIIFNYTPKDKAGNAQSQGDDAHFVFAEKNTIGVADGVGGWARYGVDTGKYAHQLMSNVVTAVQR